MARALKISDVKDAIVTNKKKKIAKILPHTILENTIGIASKINETPADGGKS